MHSVENRETDDNSKIWHFPLYFYLPDLHLVDNEVLANNKVKNSLSLFYCILQFSSVSRLSTRTICNYIPRIYSSAYVTNVQRTSIQHHSGECNFTENWLERNSCKHSNCKYLCRLLQLPMYTILLFSKRLHIRNLSMVPINKSPGIASCQPSIMSSRLID